MFSLCRSSDRPEPLRLSACKLSWSHDCRLCLPLFLLWWVKKGRKKIMVLTKRMVKAIFVKNINNKLINILKLDHRCSLSQVRCVFRISPTLVWALKMAILPNRDENRRFHLRWLYFRLRMRMDESKSRSSVRTIQKFKLKINLCFPNLNF